MKQRRRHVVKIESLNRKQRLETTNWLIPRLFEYQQAVAENRAADLERYEIEEIERLLVAAYHGYRTMPVFYEHGCPVTLHDLTGLIQIETIRHYVEIAIEHVTAGGQDNGWLEQIRSNIRDVYRMYFESRGTFKAYLGPGIPGYHEPTTEKLALAFESQLDRLIEEIERQASVTLHPLPPRTIAIDFLNRLGGEFKSKTLADRMTFLNKMDVLDYMTRGEFQDNDRFKGNAQSEIDLKSALGQAILRFVPGAEKHKETGVYKATGWQHITPSKVGLILWRIGTATHNLRRKMAIKLKPWTEHPS